MAANKYRSIYTGIEIDQLLSSVPNKIDISSISNDFNGGINKVASAELVKKLNDTLTSALSSGNILSIIESIPGFVIFTANDQTKLDSLNTDFVGVFSTISDRDSQLDVSNYIHDKFAFITNDTGIGTPFQQLTYWKYSGTTGVGTWKNSIFDKPVITSNQTISTTFTPIQFDSQYYKVCKILLYAYTTIKFHYTEILLTSDGTNVYYNSFNTIKNDPSTNIFTISASQSSTIVNLVVNHGGLTATYKIKMIELF